MNRSWCYSCSLSPVPTPCRTTLLGQLSVYMRTLHDDFVQRSSGHQSSAGGDQAAPPKGKNLPEVVNNIVWARGLESNVSGRVDYSVLETNGRGLAVCVQNTTERVK